LKSQTTEGDITLRSLKLDEWKSIPSKLIVEGFMRNGKLHKKKSEIFYKGPWRGYLLFSFTKCPCCNGDIGLLCLLEGKLFFKCMGLSCLIKNLNKHKKVPRN